MRTLGQKRAEFALEQVYEAVKNMDKKEKDEFKSFTAGVPSMILMNGFGQTLAFFISKKKETKYIIVFKMLQKWLSVKNKYINQATDEKGFMAEIAKTDQCHYLDAQKEALKFLEWVKRFAAMEAPGGNE
jgi:CRISPR-associated protein Cmr5